MLVTFILRSQNAGTGYQATVRIDKPGTPGYAESEGFLPAVPVSLDEVFRQWRDCYFSSGRETAAKFRDLSIQYTSEANQSQVSRINPESSRSGGDPTENARRLRQELNIWLNNTSSRTWLDVRDHLVGYARTDVNDSKSIRLLLQFDDPRLRRLPWQAWDVFQNFYSGAEVAFFTPGGFKPSQGLQQGNSVRILVVVGNSKGIETGTQKDVETIERLRDVGANVTILRKPEPNELIRALQQQPYDIFVFTGHSRSEQDGIVGRLELNESKNFAFASITVDQLRENLGKAVKKGLKLCVFNSCDGLGLSQQFLKDLKLPIAIIMREPVPDGVAVKFLQNFFELFAFQGYSLFAAFQEATFGLEEFTQFPGITWLPAICISSLAEPPTWQQLGATTSNSDPQSETQLPESNSKQQSETQLPESNSKQQSETQLPESNFKQQSETQLPESNSKQQSETQLPESNLKQQSETQLSESNCKEQSERLLADRSPLKKIKNWKTWIFLAAITTVLVVAFPNIINSFHNYPAFIGGTKLSAPTGRQWRYGGSKSLVPIEGKVKAPIKQAFSGKYDLQEYEPTGTVKGRSMLSSSQLDFILASAADNASNIKYIAIAKDAIVIAVNPALPLSRGLTLDELRDIYTGKIENWKLVDGPDLQIKAFYRSLDESGTSEYFMKKLEITTFSSKSNSLEASPTQMAQQIYQTKGAIYFGTASEVLGQCQVKPISIGNTKNDLFLPYKGTAVFDQPCPNKQPKEINLDAINNNQYPLIRDVFIGVPNDDSDARKAGEDYANMLLTGEGQDIIKSVGFAPLHSSP